MDTLKAIVFSVIPNGNHGPFAIAKSDQLDGSVTFSLEPAIWKESDRPEEGSVVFLSKLRKKRAGWRAKEARFWKPSDEHTQQRAQINGFQFLYPIIMQYPFDSVCQQIVLELEKRNWEVPGIAVEFSEYGTGELKYRMVSTIRSDDFMLRFCRVQHRLPGGWNDIAAVTEIVIPRQHINVFEDESGPSYHLYVGGNWERDKKKFMCGSKVNSKLRREPRTYLSYKGSSSPNGGVYFQGQRPPYLVHDNDLGREYDPIGKEPKRLMTQKVLDVFRRYLETRVVTKILAEPIPKKKVDRFAVPPPTPFPASIGPLFCFAEDRDARRILEGRKNPAELEPEDRYGMQGSGYRLMSLGTKNDGTVPEKAYDGFLWCGIGEVFPETPIDSLKIPDHYRWSDQERFVLRIKPNRADGIYIADHAAYEKRRKELIEAATDKRTDFTKEEIADFVCARGRTLVPISEYTGGYAEPVVLVNRELSLDEVEVVSGPHKDRFGH